MFEERYGIMLDLETLGILDDTTIIQIGAVLFDRFNEEILEKFESRMDIRTIADQFDSFIEDIKKNKEKRDLNVTGKSLVKDHLFIATEQSIDAGTLDFWMKTESNFNKFIELIDCNNGVSEWDMLNQFKTFVQNAQMTYGDSITIWGNGISFDVVKIKKKMMKYDLEFPIMFYYERDVRTLLELASLKSNMSINEIKNSVPKNNYAHDALEDCIFQVNYLVYALNIILDKI